ncbi:MAG TPA: ferritin family protein [Desulfomonilaceae bacterium]|nr:ferritin family protein [Desulfomonilaceae bacterium]
MSDSEIKIFEYALNQEKTGINFFRNALPRMGIGAAVTAFEQLIREEQKHILFINSIINDLRQKGEISSERVESTIVEPVNYFDERARNEFLEQCIEGSMVPDVTVFNTAWLIEKDLSEFYAKMADQTDGKARKALLMLSAWEKEHERFFKEFRDKLSETYANMPWGG